MSCPSEWSYIFGSARGASHAERNEPCQDAVNCTVIHGRDGCWHLLALVADGAGSAACGEIGAWVASDHFTNCVQLLLKRGSTLIDVNFSTVERWLIKFHELIRRRAARDGESMSAYQCTLLGAVIGGKYSVFFQVGDGAIVVAPANRPDDLEIVHWPHRGEYANVTYFATQPDAPSRLQFSCYSEPIDELAMFSDGIERLVLDFRNRTPHAPFFLPKLEALRREPVGYRSEMAHRLYQYLNSPEINSRSSDDKTLILATRRIDSRWCKDTK